VERALLRAKQLVVLGLIISKSKRSLGPLLIRIAFITDYAAVDRITNHLKFVFVAEKPPPQVAYQELLMPAETSGDYFL
jgi:hypothetical protein